MRGSTAAPPARNGWLLLDVAGGGTILEEPPRIAEYIRSTPKTPRVVTLDKPTFTELRKRAESHIKSTYLKSLQVPIGVNAKLLCWMELN